MRQLASLLLLLAACGGGSTPTPEQQLPGIWLDVDAAGSGTVLTLKSDDRYVVETILATGTNAGNDQVQEGSFSINGGQLGLVPDRSSCPGPQPGFWVMWSLAADGLTITDGDGTSTFTRSTVSPTAGGQFTFGCFLPEGFVANPVSPL